MFDKIVEQSQKMFGPSSELMSLSAKAFEQVAEKQKTLFNEIVNDNVAFVKDLSAQKDLSGVYQTQKSYLQNIQDKMVVASTDAYELVSTSQEKAGEVIKKATTAK